MVQTGAGRAITHANDVHAAVIALLTNVVKLCHDVPAPLGEDADATVPGSHGSSAVAAVRKGETAMTSKDGAEPRDQPADAAGAAAASAAAIKRWRLADLLGDRREAIIEHGGESYRLRLTANKKLILTK